MAVSQRYRIFERRDAQNRKMNAKMNAKSK